MLHLAAWLVVCAALTWALRARPWVTMMVALVLWTLVPAVAAHRVTGQEQGLLAMHPASYLIIVATALAVITLPRMMFDALAQHGVVASALAFFIAAAGLTSYLLGSSGIKLLFDMVIAPVLLFWVLVAGARRDASVVDALRRTIVLAVSFQCLLSVIERVRGGLLFYESDYERLSWFDPARFDRWMGTADNHLILAYAICVAAPLTVGVRNSWLRLGLLTLQLLGAVITQSRTVAAAFVVVVVFLLLRGRMSALARLVSASAMAIGVFALLSSPLTEGIRGRVSNDHGSAAARGSAYDYFFSHLSSYIFTGNGLMSSYKIAARGGLSGSFENSAVMYTIDVGLLATLAYFGAMVALLLRHGPGNPVRGASLAVTLAILVTLTFSGLGFSNMIGVFLWGALALLTASSQPPGPDEQIDQSSWSRARRRVAASASV